MKPCAYRNAIVRLANKGESSLAISRKFKISQRTVQRVVKLWKEKKNVSPKKSCGRKRTANVRRIRSLISKRITRNPELSMNLLASKLKIARSTCQNIIKKTLGYKSYKIRKVHFISDDAKVQRLIKCKKLLEKFKVRRISNVLWTDEKLFSVERPHNNQNDRQLIREGAKFYKQKKLATKKLFPKSLMVWGGISATGKTKLVFIDENVKINAKVYQEKILSREVRAWKNNNPHVILQQDWAPAHRAKTTISYLKKNFPGFINRENWPANSPDLNPLDFSVWGYMESKLKFKKITNLSHLRRELVKIWNSLDINYLRRTIESVIPRLKACVEAKGGQFEVNK